MDLVRYCLIQTVPTNETRKDFYFDGKTYIYKISTEHNRAWEIVFTSKFHGQTTRRHGVPTARLYGRPRPQSSYRIRRGDTHLSEPHAVIVCL